MVAEYASDIGRDDLPLGFLMLIDQICAELFDGPLDPLIHVANKWDYSLSPIPGGRAFVLHLPAVDPTNVLLAPVLAHELSHAKFSEIAAEFNEQRASVEAELDRLLEEWPVEEAAEQGKRETILPVWSQELFCDAAATLVAGPAYLLAFMSRVGGAGWALDKDHPPQPIRVHVIRKILRFTGWMPYIERASPEIALWMEDRISQRPPTGNALISFLYFASKAMSDIVVELAVANLARPFGPTGSIRRIHEIATHYRHLVLPTDMTRSEHSEWEFVLGAWLVGLDKTAFALQSIPDVSRDPQLNGLVVKTIELSKIAALWAESEPR